MDLSFSEILVIFVLVLLLFGPKKIPEIARSLGQGFRKMNEAMNSVKSEILDEEKNPLSDISKEIEKAKESVENITNTNTNEKEDSK